MQTEQKVKDKYLGDLFQSGSDLGASVLSTIRQREGKVRAAIRETAGLVEDFRAEQVGGFMMALDLWNIPTLLYNAETWTEMGKEAEKLLEDLQNTFVSQETANLHSKGQSPVRDGADIHDEQGEGGEADVDTPYPGDERGEFGQGCIYGTGE